MKFNASNYIEDQEQIDALEAFAPKVREILRAYRTKRQLSAIAASLGFHGARLAEMVNKDAEGNYKRRISPYYLAKFIEGGVMTVEDILGGRRLQDIPERARMFFERMILSRKTINLVVEAKRRGIDVDKLLETILYPDTSLSDNGRP